jgi:hypothetical protein
LIRVHALSRDSDKALKAAAVIENCMFHESLSPVVRPNIVAYNAVLNAAEHTDNADVDTMERALKMACHII